VKHKRSKAWFHDFTICLQTVRLRVDECPEDGTTCEECPVGTSCYNETQILGSL